MQLTYRGALLGLVVVALTACGGGGGSGGSDSPNNTPNINKSPLLQELENGLHSINMFSQFIGVFPPSVGAVWLTHSRFSSDNGGYHAESSMALSGTWMSMGNGPSGLALTASGWQDRSSTPCTLDDTNSGTILTCIGTQERITFEPVADLATTSLADVLVQIASTDLAHDDRFYQAVVAGTAGMTELMSADARTYRLTSIAQTASLTVAALSCQPATPNQPVAEWNCDSGFTSTTWEELALSGEAFWLSDNNGLSIVVQLDGDPADASNGNIVISDLMPPLSTPGTIVGTWEKRTVYGQSIIQLILPTATSGFQNALAIVNGRIVQAIYQPSGSQNSSLVFNAAAATTLNNAAVSLFPLTVNE